MVWGAVWCETNHVRDIADAIREIKQSQGVAPNFEAKWTKVSPAKVTLYRALIEYFLSDERLRFRGLVVPDKSCLDHSAFDQTHDEWYYKMYFNMLKYTITPPNRYRVYLDIKDTRGGNKSRHLHDVLANNVYDFSKEYIEKVQQIRSHESEIMQLADLLIGAIAYANRKLHTSRAKVEILRLLETRLGSDALTSTSSFGARKFNILVWEPSRGGVV
jgi:hypothetical protein